MKNLLFSILCIFMFTTVIPTAFAHEPDFEVETSEDILKLCYFYHEEYLQIGTEKFRDHHKFFLNANICPIVYENIAWNSQHSQKDKVLISEIEKKFNENSNYIKNRHVEGENIPKGLQNQVNLWVMGEIKDKEFCDTIKEIRGSNSNAANIVKNILLVESSDTPMPKWIKQNTNWYINGMILEKEFLDSVNYVIRSQ